MSGNSGLPPGLPQRPNFNSYGEQHTDSYRPLPPPPKIDYSSQSRDSDRRSHDTFQFGGNSNSNSNQTQPRGGGDSYAPRTTSYRGDPPSYPRGALDSYRPPASDFSFRAEAPRGVDVARTYDTYRPSDSTRRQNDRDRGARNDRGPRRDNSSRGGQSSRGRGGYQGRSFQSRKAADRPFLSTNREKTPELMPGMDEAEEHLPKFRALDDVESDKESDGPQEGSGAEQEDGQPKKKQARTTTSGAADGNSIPKWSNPDPYTALPCPDESAAKKKDVVKLIRKARVSAGHEVAKKTAETDDFISFNFDEDEEEEEDESGDKEDDHMSISSDDEAQVVSKSQPSPPTGPRADKSFSHRDEVVGERPAVKSDISTPQAKPRAIDTSTDPELGNRKRTFDDQIKGPPMTPKPVPKWPAKGGIVSQWRAKEKHNATPWLADHSMTENMGAWLHMEIVDFFNCFKPVEVEQDMRRALIEDLQSAVVRDWHDAKILPFGSYPAGLYLPTADMDLVFVSQNYMDGGYAKYNSKSHLFRFRDFLYKHRIAAEQSVEVISKAKVPLVKYIDRLTGLRVDVSFENDTGIVAIETFNEWKRQYPAMPILVTLIKQFLCMRGLNEPVNGGIGGFTVTCLVVSLLQHMPQIQSMNMIPEHHLGEVLMEFFNLYGNLFDVSTTAIQTKPPRWISKAAANRQLYRANSAAKFCIIDPNDEGNDISGGSTNTSAILQEFRGALVALNKRMGELRTMSFADRKNQSILGCILGGDYSSFEIQRNHLERVWQTSHDRR